MANEATLAVGVNSRGAVVGAKKYQQAMNGIQTATTRTGGILTKFGGAFAGLFAGISAVMAVKKTISTISAFEDTMAELEGVTNATGAQMERFSKVARQLGATTRFSATQASEGLLALSRAGFSAKESIEAIASTLQLATASNLELGRSSEIVSNTIRQFGLEAKQAGLVADVLVNTANRANTDVEALAESMKFAGVMAGQFGIPLEETSASLGVLANVGLKGGIAGRNLAQVLSKLVAPSTEAQRALQGLGLTMDDINPQKVGLTGAMEALSKANADATSLTKIFSGAQLKVVLPLMKNVDAVKQLTKENEKSNGIAEKNARLMEGTLKGAFLELKSAIEEVMLSAGDTGFLGVLKDIIKFTTSVVRSLTGVGDATSEVFLKMQIRINKVVWFFKDFFTKVSAGYKMIWAGVEWVSSGFVNFWKKAFNFVIDAFKSYIRQTLFGMADIIEAMELPASFVSSAMKEEMQKARTEIYNFTNDATEKLNGIKVEVEENLSISERQNIIYKETEEKLKVMKQAHTNVHSELQKQLNVLVQQRLQLEKARREKETILKIEKDILTQQQQWEIGKGASEAGRFAGRSDIAGGGGLTPETIREIDRQKQNMVGYLSKIWQVDEATGKVLGKIAEMAGAIGNKTREMIDKGVNALGELTEQTSKFKITWEDVGGAVSGTLTDALLKTKSWNDALRDVTDTLIRMAMQRAIMTAFTPAPITAGAKGLIAMASGGVVSGPTPALIGEAGPEAVIPLKRGENGELGIESAGTQVVNNNFSLVSPDSRGIKDMLLRDPKLIRQMNETYRQGYAID